MPIRMTDDPQDRNQNDYNNDTGGRRPGGGGGGLGGLLPLLGLFKGKGIIVLLVLGAGAYFLLGKGGGCNMTDLQNVVSQFSQSGYSFNPDEFNKASVYEGLEEDNSKNPLPEAVSLLRYAPPRGDQGQQGSCVAWSSAYAAQTILKAAATHEDPATIAFSPSYLYNQIRLEDCQGSYVQRAMEAMQRNGGVPISQYPYTDRDCERMPSSNDVSAGRQNTIHGFTRLTNGDNINSISVRAVKEHLSKDAPVVIGMMVGNSFMDMQGRELWTPQSMDASQVGMGGHAMCVIGYDDRKFGGAFQIMNSWGEKWGENGVAWVRYGDFKTYVKEAYGIDPLPKRSSVANIPLECTIGLVRNEDSRYITLRSIGANSFETTTPIKPGTRFKMEIKNETECYIYIFGAEADGRTSYVLFPYLKSGETVSKHSPYCGITGYRVFPKDQSMEPDNVGTRDYIAVVVSKEELDYHRINNAITQASGSTYAEKVNAALQADLIPSARFTSTAEGKIHFSVDANNNKAVATVVAFDKN